MKSLLLFSTLALSGVCGLQAAAKDHDHHHHKHHGHSQKAHSHGEGQLKLAVEGKNLHIEIEIPAHDILGFEHAPKTDEQKAAIKQAAALFSDSTKVFEFSPAAKCAPQGQPQVTSAITDSKEGHNEFSAKYVFSCEDTSKLTQLKILIFSRFTSLHKLKASAATEQQQTSQDLSPKNSVLKLGKK